MVLHFKALTFNKNSFTFKPLKKINIHYSIYTYNNRITKLPIIVLNNIISNFYMTNSITRDSFIMASVSELRLNKINLNIM